VVWCGNANITNCIIWGNNLEQIAGGTPTYSCIQDWSAGGTGNIDDDPLFADPNRRNFHLQSTAGRWDPNSQSWIYDQNTSPCIDAGNPGYPLGSEPNDASNVRIDMGAYGGTTEASRAPPGWGLLADLSNDWTVDYADLAHQAKNWKQSEDYLPGDLNRDGSVDLPDVVLFAYDWLSARFAH
jgi:hypothetical protein